jgi:HSP20 family protein
LRSPSLIRWSLNSGGIADRFRGPVRGPGSDFAGEGGWGDPASSRRRAIKMSELVPWKRSQVSDRRGEVPARGVEELNPFFAFHREVSRLFDDVFRGFFRGFDIAPFRLDRGLFDQRLGWPSFMFAELHQEIRIFDGSPFAFGRGTGWPNVEVTELDQEIQVRAELPEFDEKDVNVELSNNELVIAAESRRESEDRDRRFSERGYGRFERRIPLDREIEEDKVAASFRDGVLTVTLPKLRSTDQRKTRIPINGR